MDKLNELEKVYNKFIDTLEKKMLKNKEDITNLIDEMENIALILYKD
jgi:hypothetical protein